MLVNTLISIVSPKAIEAPPVIIGPVAQTSALFSRRRAAIEAQDRENAKILREKRNLGMSDEQMKFSQANSIEALERELEIPDEKES